MFLSFKNVLFNGTAGSMLASSFAAPLFPSLIQEITDKFTKLPPIEIVEEVVEGDKEVKKQVVKKVQTREELAAALATILQKHKKDGCEFQFQFEDQSSHQTLDNHSWTNQQMSAVIRVATRQDSHCQRNKSVSFRKGKNAETGASVWFHAVKDIVEKVIK